MDTVLARLAVLCPSQEAVTRRAAGLCWLGTDLSARRLDLAENLQQNAHTASPCASPMPVPTPGQPRHSPSLMTASASLPRRAPATRPLPSSAKKSCRSGNGQNNGTPLSCKRKKPRCGGVSCMQVLPSQDGGAGAGWATCCYSPEPPVPCRKTDGLCRGVVFFLWIVPCGS